MNILIYGGKGWIGSQFCSLINKETPNVNTIHLGKARADNIQAVKAEIKEIKPELCRTVGTAQRCGGHGESGL